MNVSFDLSAISDANRPYLSCMMPDGVEFDNIAYKTIDFTTPVFMLPLQKVEIRNMLEFRYFLNENYVAMNEFAPEYHPDIFLMVMRNMLIPLLDCDDFFLNKLNFDMDSQHVFIDKSNLDVKLLYIPTIQSFYTDEAFTNKIIQIIRKTKIKNGVLIKGLFFELLNEDCTLLDIFNAVNEITAEVSHNFQPAPEPHFVAEPKPDIEPDSPFIVNASVAKPDSTSVEPVLTPLPKEPVKKNISFNNPSTEILMTKPKSAETSARGISLNHSETELITDRRQPIAKPTPNPSIEDTITEKMELGDTTTEVMRFDDSVTELMDMNMHACKTYLRYIGVKAGLPQRINIETVKNNFVIGRFDGVRPNKQNHYEFQHNDHTNAISRMHARIQYNRGGYEIVDLSSMHGTFVNAIKITPNSPYPLKSGDKISLSKNGIDYLFINEG